jgi:hypothetical protein
LSLKFIHIPKSAGTSVLSLLYPDNRIQHLLASDISKSEWENNTWFAIIRNPYDRFISAWKYHSTYSDHMFYDKTKNLNIDEYVDFVKKVDCTCNNYKTATEYITRCDSIKENVDEILFFENLKHDWSNFSKIFNIDKHLPFKKSTCRSKDYRKYYTDYSFNFVSIKYKKDLIKFNYTF